MFYHVIGNCVNKDFKAYFYEVHIVMLLCDCFREDLWEGVRRLHERLAHVDQTQLVACDMTTRVTVHFERLRLAQVAAV